MSFLHRPIAIPAALAALLQACSADKSTPVAPPADASREPDSSVRGDADVGTRGDADAGTRGDEDAGPAADARPDAYDSAVDAGDGTVRPGTCPTSNALKNPYFGDLHAHTSFSADAFSFGTRNAPLDAYAFAKGKALRIEPPDAGGPITMIDRPLDFLAVTDHSESLDMAAWQGVQSAAAAANAPCSFTSFVAYEWTLGGPGPHMLHKNVLFA